MAALVTDSLLPYDGSARSPNERTRSRTKGPLMKLQILPVQIASTLLTGQDSSCQRQQKLKLGLTLRLFIIALCSLQL